MCALLHLVLGHQGDYVFAVYEYLTDVYLYIINLMINHRTSHKYQLSEYVAQKYIVAYLAL